jgi:hypothetical protein
LGSSVICGRIPFSGLVFFHRGLYFSQADHRTQGKSLLSLHNDLIPQGQYKMAGIKVIDFAATLKFHSDYLAHNWPSFLSAALSNSYLANCLSGLIYPSSRNRTMAGYKNAELKRVMI